MIIIMTRDKNNQSKSLVDSGLRVRYSMVVVSRAVEE